MSDPRVLVTTYPTAFLHRGGGELEVIDLLDNLRQLGVRADLYSPTALPLSKYETVLHYSMVPSGMPFVQEAKKAGKKVVLMPSIWWSHEPLSAEIETSQEFLRQADVVVLKSKAELENIQKYLSLDSKKVAFCPWAVDQSFGQPVEKGLFKSTYQLGDYILCVGLIEETKNQLAAIQALKDQQIPLVFIGDYRSRSYYEACVKAAPAHFKFIPYTQPKSELLRAAYQECKVYLELSLEPPGFSAFEAALSGVPLVISRSNWAQEHFGDWVTQVDPRSYVDIRRGLNVALLTAPAPELVQKIRTSHMLPQAFEPLVRLLQHRS